MQAFADFRLKITKASDSNHYWWEIYRFGNPVWIERSSNDFATDGEACRDGALALSRFQNREAQTRSMPVTTSAEAFCRQDSSWAVAIYSDGIRDIFGRFASKSEALDWIEKNRERPSAQTTTQAP